MSTNCAPLFADMFLFIKYYCILNFLIIYNILFVAFGDTFVPQSIEIPMGTNCASLFEDLFLFITKLNSSRRY